MERITLKKTATITLDAGEYFDIIQAIDIRIRDCESMLHDTDDTTWSEQLTDDIVSLRSAEKKIVEAFTAETH